MIRIIQHDKYNLNPRISLLRCTDICEEQGQGLIDARNHHADSIAQRCEQLRNKMYNLGELAVVRKTNLKACNCRLPDSFFDFCVNMKVWLNELWLLVAHHCTYDYGDLYA